MAEYIERRVALDALGVTKNATKYGGDHSGYDTRMLYEIHDALIGIPAADVVPVVHGEWKPHEDKQVAFGLAFECSCCGSIVLVNDALEFGYCPYCGAKMDGERKE